MREEVKSIRENAPNYVELGKDLLNGNAGDYVVDAGNSIKMQAEAFLKECKADSMENQNRRDEGKVPDVCGGVSMSEEESSGSGSGCIIF